MYLSPDTVVYLYFQETASTTESASEKHDTYLDNAGSGAGEPYHDYHDDFDDSGEWEPETRLDSEELLREHTSDIEDPPMGLNTSSGINWGRPPQSVVGDVEPLDVVVATERRAAHDGVNTLSKRVYNQQTSSTSMPIAPLRLPPKPKAKVVVSTIQVLLSLSTGNSW